MFPLFLDLTGRLVAVIGGGEVARRKAAALLDAGALVRLVCLEARPDDFAHGNLNWITAPYALSHLDGAVLAFAAAPPEVNRRVVTDAALKGIWVNCATQPREGDFILPAVLRRGDFVLAVSTGGASPCLTQVVRDRLAEQFDDTFATWIALLAELRPLIVSRFSNRSARHDIFERLCGWEWLDRLRAEGVEAVRRAMRADAGLDDA